jgi:hypothetical protein
MTWKRTIVAGIVLAVCLLLLALDRTMTLRARYERINQQSLAPGVNLSEIVEARVRHRGTETVLAKENGSWRVKTPTDAAADPEVVEQLLVNVTAARRNNEIEVKNLAEYGLATPELSLVLRTEKGPPFEIQVGNESTYTGQVFAKYPNTSKVFTVGDHVRAAMLREAKDWRRLRLLDIDTADLGSYTGIGVAAKDKTLALRNERGVWMIASPVEAPAETEIVTDYLRKAGLLRASSFITEKSDKPTSMATALQALASPVLTFTVEKAGAQPQRLTVGRAGTDEQPVYVAQRAGESEVMAISGSAFDEMSVDENYFRSRTVFSVPARDVGTLSIEIGKLRTDLERDEKGEWRFLGEPTRRVDQEQVNLRLDALLRTRVRDFVDVQPQDLGAYGLLPPQIRFTLSTRDKQRSEGLEVGKREPNQAGSAFARRTGDKAVFLMDMSAGLVISPDAVADRKFAKTDQSRLERFEIELDGQKHSFRRDGGEWQTLKPGQTAYATVNASRVNRVLALLNEIECIKDHAASGETVIAPSEGASLAVRLYAKGDEELLTLTVGRRVPDHTFVGTGAGRTYDVRNADVDILTAAAKSLTQ